MSSDAASELDDLRRLDTDLVERGVLLNDLMSASHDCVKLIDREGRLQFMSEGGRRVMEVDDFALLRGVYWPDNFPEPGRTAAMAALAAAAAGEVGRFQAEAPTAKGTMKWWDVMVSPIRSGDGRVGHLLSISRDITDMKRIEAQHALLVQELQHRVKNTLSVVQSLVRQTLRAAPDPQAATALIDERLAAMAEAYELLFAAHWQSAPLRALTEATLRVPRIDPAQVELEGPDLMLASGVVLGFTLVLYELATNAMKYGALTSPGGRVSISWRPEGSKLIVDWVESGGPPVAAPQRLGFGSRLIQTALRGAGRKSEVSYAPDGLRWRFESPLEGLAADVPPPAGPAA
ncbi:MAG: PAS domain-containing protein [Phenylobacterium sp.]|uniref:HWE histidine kinase domain-containing protein n=1 Tax=Phenylobacterium sp. TaxID=1871053 RepID=UPI001A503C24|nr:HWE histidine kinase domain-containing protein [Phenylobacterium sp.]MBL8772322.1 PAS domain-containing protein [Phenylobacterium sp.]